MSKKNTNPQKKNIKNNSILNTLQDNVQRQKEKKLVEQQKALKKTKLAKVQREEKADSYEAKLKANILKFNEEGFKLIEEDDIEFIVPQLSISEGNIGRSWNKDARKSFFAINSITLFQSLCDSINYNLNKTVTTKDKKDHHKYYHKIDIIETIQFIGLYILIENQYSIESKDIEVNYRYSQ
jgi:hypothetical protein